MEQFAQNHAVLVGLLLVPQLGQSGSVVNASMKSIWHPESNSAGLVHSCAAVDTSTRSLEE